MLNQIDVISSTPIFAAFLGVLYVWPTAEYPFFFFQMNCIEVFKWVKLFGGSVSLACARFLRLCCWGHNLSSNPEAKKHSG
jgi:hypothetical protein